MSSMEPKYKIWDPLKILIEGDGIAFLILNQALYETDMTLLKKLWEKASLRIAVDGGIFSLKNMEADQEEYIPDIICGDLDSATKKILDVYSTLGVEIILTPDQDENDFTKALRICSEKISEKNLDVKAVFAVTSHSGRLDHTLGNLNTLYIATELNLPPLYIIGNNMLTWLLEKGRHKIIAHEQYIDEYVGLIPLGCPCQDVTTTGLKWNLSHDKMQFGGLISTSNELLGDVTIENDENLIWTITMKN